MLLKKSHILPSAGPTYRACKTTIAVLVKRKVCASEKQPHVLPSADSKTLTLHVTRSTQLLFVFKNKIILDNYEYQKSSSKLKILKVKVIK